MSTTTDFPETLLEAVGYFADTQRAHEFMLALRWPDGKVLCPERGSGECYWLTKQARFKCRACKTQFSLKTGTVFEDSPLPLSKWLPCVWLIVNAKNGISSCEVARALGVTQKTAWFMLQRIRLAMQDKGVVRAAGGVFECDETFIGAKARNMHKDVKEKRGIKGGDGMQAKTAVMALLDRHTKGHSTIRAHAVLPGMPTKKAAMSMLKGNVNDGAEVHTDQAQIYEDVPKDYTHEVINHAESYVRDGVIHTNGLENFWSLLKRMLKGTYVSVEPFHLFRYLGEQVFRFNERKHEHGDKGRFLLGMAGILGKRLTYKRLIGAEGSDGLPAAVV